MRTDTLDKHNASLIQHHLERLFEIDDKVNFLNQSEYNELSDLLIEIKEYSAKLS